MKTKSLIFVVLVAVMLTPAWAMAGTVEGSVQGLTCVTTGTICPVGDEDPMAAAEKIFVVLAKDNSFYFIPNLDRAVLARHIGQLVRVTGNMDDKYNSITAKSLDVYADGAWKTKWSQAMQDRINLKFMAGGPN
jgi:hypothetical protein